jgi:hypothetical protein
MNLAPIGEDPVNVLQHQRALRIPRQFRFLPGREMRLHLGLQSLNPIVKLLNLAAYVVILPRQRSQSLKLLLNLS